MSKRSYVAMLTQNRKPNKVFRPRDTLTGPDGLLAAIEAAVEQELFNPADLSDLTIWTQDKDDLS